VLIRQEPIGVSLGLAWQSRTAGALEPGLRGAQADVQPGGRERGHCVDGPVGQDSAVAVGLSCPRGIGTPSGLARPRVHSPLAEWCKPSISPSRGGWWLRLGRSHLGLEAQHLQRG